MKSAVFVAMAYCILVWLILGIACLMVGTGVLNRLAANVICRTGDRLILSLWLGVLTLSITLLALSCVLPLSPLVGLVLAIALSIASLSANKTRQEISRYYRTASGWIKPAGLWMSGVIIAIAAIISQPVTWIDTGLYHFQSIQWLAKYGTVSGLTLLFGNYGFTSAWFALAAPLQWGVLDGRGSAIANGFMILLVLLQLFVVANRILEHRSRLNDYFIGLFLFFSLIAVFFFKHFLTILISASPDIPVLFLVGLIVWTILLLSDPISQPNHLPTIQHGRAIIVSGDVGGDVRGDVRGDRLIPIIFASGAIALKLVAIPLLPLTILFYVIHPLPAPAPNVKPFSLLRRSLVAIAVATFILLPFCWSGLITSGCPLYPSSLFCLDLPWSPEPSVTKVFEEATHRWSSWYGSAPEGTNPILWLLWTWFASNRLNQLVACLVIMAIPLSLVMLKLLKTVQWQGRMWGVAIALSGVTFLMATSPLLRFTFAYLLIVPCLVLGTVLESRIQNSKFKIQNSKLKVKNGRVALIVGLVLILTVCVKDPRQILLPLPLREQVVVQRQVNGIVHFVPVGRSPEDKALCWGTPLPCAFEIPPQVYLRDPQRGLAGGFIRQRTK
jgi:hypothetical protein